MAEPVLASIFAVFIFSEQVSLFDWVTFAVVLVGIYLAQSSQSAVKVTNEGTQADVLIETQKMVTEAICLWQQRFAIAIHNIPIKKPW